MHNGVRIFGKLNLPGLVPVNASSLYARNLQAFVEPLIDKEKKTLAVNWDDELVKGTLIARDGAIVNGAIAERLGVKAGPAAWPRLPMVPRRPSRNLTRNASRREARHDA